MKKIVYIPLDMRPPTTTWIKKLSKRAKVSLVSFDFNQTGTLLKKADEHEIKSFIENEIHDADYLLVSLDALTSGGLVQSRLGNIDLAHAKDQSNFFKSLKNKNKHLKIYCFDTLMRTSVTAYGYDSANIWSQMNKYAKLRGSLLMNEDEMVRNEFDNLIKTINPNDLNRFLKAREVKHEMNKFYIDLVNLGVIDYLIILQEDCMVNGFQIEEQNILSNIINQNNLSNKVKVYNGTDEGACVLLAKILVEIGNLNPKFYIDAINLDYLKFSQPFEDRPFIENIKNMFEVIQISESDKSKSDMILSIFTGSKELNHDEASKIKITDLNENDFNNYINKLNNLITNNKVGLLDIYKPNGGMLALLLKINFNELKCYSAWNTASNALGSLLCDMIVTLIETNENKSFLYERIIDDCIYQSNVRSIINQNLQNKGINLYNFDSSIETMNQLLKDEMSKFDYLHNQKYNVFFPWNRTFEIDINVGDDNDV